MITDFQGVLLLEFLGLQPVLKPLAKLQYRAHLKKSKIVFFAFATY